MSWGADVFEAAGPGALRTRALTSGAARSPARPNIGKWDGINLYVFAASRYSRKRFTEVPAGEWGERMIPPSRIVARNPAEGEGFEPSRGLHP
jgi:hypothetical protein